MLRLLLSLFLLAALSVASAREFVVAIDHFPPWKIVSSGGKKFSGIEVEMINRVVSEYNSRFSPKLEVSYVECPWRRCLNLLKGGKVDLISGILRKPEREKYLYFLEPPYKNKSTKAFYLKKKKGLKVNRFKDLYGKVVGVVTGATFFERFDRDQQIIKMETISSARNLQMLEKERFDVIIATERQMDYLLATKGLNSSIIKANYKFDKKIEVFFSLSKKSIHAGSAKRLELIISRLKREGVFHQITQNYFKRLTPQ